MNAHEITIALTGRARAEKFLRETLSALIDAEKRALATKPFLADEIVAEADNFYLWEGVRTFGDTLLRVEGVEPVEIGEASLTFGTNYRGFLITVDAADEVSMFLSNAVVDMVSNGDITALDDFVQSEINKIMHARKERKERVRALYERVEVMVIHMQDNPALATALEGIGDGSAVSDNCFSGDVAIYNTLICLDLVADVGGFPCITGLGDRVIKRLSGEPPVLLDGARKLKEMRGD